MRIAISALVLLGLQDARLCEHAGRGATRPIDLDRVERAYREVARAIAFQVERQPAADLPAAPYESGLPACRSRQRRRVLVEALPEEIVGKSLHFGPRGRKDSIHAITSAQSLRDAIGGVLATRELADRFGVRCAPSTAHAVSPTEIHIDEDD